MGYIRKVGYVRKEKSTVCEKCGETDKSKLMAYTPICRGCKYRGTKGPKKELMIKINVPDDVEDPKDFYKKEWQRLYYQLNKERYKTRKRVRTLKKYCGLLNRDIDEYLKNDPSYDEIKLINENLEIYLDKLFNTLS